jgi:hypothetical protein
MFFDIKKPVAGATGDYFRVEKCRYVFGVGMD